MATTNWNGQQQADVSFNRIPEGIRERWALVRDVVLGDSALRAGEYLPMLNKFDNTPENIARNAAYRQRAVWYPATQFTLEGLTGLAFRTDPQLKVPKAMSFLEKDCDGAGVSIFQQSQAAVSHILQIGRHGLYVDWSEGLNHSVIKPYNGESITNWRFVNKQGRMQLRMVVFHEETEVESGEWGVSLVEQWREVYIGADETVYCRLWQRPPSSGPTANPEPPVIVPQQDSNGVMVPALQLRSRAKPLEEIPFVFIGAQNNDGGIDNSPLYGLAQINLAHFRNSADYEDSVFFTGQVQPWMSGLTTEWRDWMQNPKDANGQPTGNKFYVGSRTLLPLPQGGAFGFAQAQPNTLVADAMDKKEAQMIAVGARLIEASAGPAQTATAEDNDREATTSILGLCVSNVNEAYQQAIRFCARYQDIILPEEGADTFKINQDFVKAAANPVIMGQLVAAWQSGIMAKADVRAFFRRLGVIATERDDAAIDADLEGEGPKLGMMGEEEADPRTGQPIARAPGQQAPPGRTRPAPPAQPPAPPRRVA